MVITHSLDICDLKNIYESTGFQYWLQQPILESYLSGNAFDYQKEYTVGESAKLKEDIREIYERIIAQNPVKEKIAIITAGAPGAGKTTLLNQERFIHSIASLGENYAYICPDDVCLKQQWRTYQAEIHDSDKSFEAKKAAYDKWRPASKAASQLILAHLIRQGYAFYLGTTSTSPSTSSFFQFLKERGYKIKLLHVSAPEEVRRKSIQKRDEQFVQTTEADIVNKGKDLPQRIYDAYLKFADQIEFYVRSDAHKEVILAAKWTRKAAADPEKKGELLIIDQAQYGKIKRIHNEIIDHLKPPNPELTWEETIEKYSVLSITPKTE
ncbi:zeta toxin family protein [Candidatus Protochlamydia phocaeensis]|uniref:zeta toxin family protein n=1 Tax=Candidatus Protochlamydia phocaeensis TaxID=1414722 RepID=UPI0008390CA5|nr:zeta toxin family protein [Candidatus Protochlamydia phocaeensis]